MRLRRAVLGLCLPLVSFGCGGAEDAEIEANVASGLPIEDAYGFAEARVRATVAELVQRYPVATDRFGHDPVETRTKEPDLGAFIDKPIEDWRSGFFSGVLWELYRHGQKADLRAAAMAYAEGLSAMKDKPIDHDLGFRFLTSFGDGLEALGEQDDPGGVWREKAKLVLLDAAASLDKLFDAGGAPVGALRAFELSNGYLAPYPTYNDSMMNVPLLFLAWDLSGRPASGPGRLFYEHAVKHADTTLTDHVRPDGSTYHIVQYEEAGSPNAGKLHKKISDQGFAAESTWSRGQAWAIYGFTETYRYTKDDPAAKSERFLDAATRAADYFIAHLPNNDLSDPYNHVDGDFVPPTDFNAALGEPAGPWNDANGDGILGDRRPGTKAYTQRDTSAAAVAASGLIALSGLVEDETLSDRYLEAAEDILESLLTFRTSEGKLAYLAADSPHRGILASGSRAFGSAEQSLIYGDYYFLEAMRRCLSIKRHDEAPRRCGAPR